MFGRDTSSHRENMQTPQSIRQSVDLNPGASYCEATILTTAPLCFLSSSVLAKYSTLGNYINQNMDFFRAVRHLAFVNFDTLSQACIFRQNRDNENKV